MFLSWHSGKPQKFFKLVALGGYVYYFIPVLEIKGTQIEITAAFQVFIYLTQARGGLCHVHNLN